MKDNRYIHCELLFEDAAAGHSVLPLIDGRKLSIMQISKGEKHAGSRYNKHQYLFYRTSSDEGRNWSLPIVIGEIPDTKNVYDFRLMTRTNEQAFLLMGLQINNYDFVNGKFEGNVVFALQKDIDSGDLVVSPIGCDKRYCGAIMNCAMLDTGRIVVPLSFYEQGHFVTSTLLHLNLRIKSFQLDSGIRGGELPIHTFLS